MLLIMRISGLESHVPHVGVILSELENSLKQDLDHLHELPWNQGHE